MLEQLRVAGIIKESIVDGPGIRYVVFAQGCRHNCPGCHNPATHAFDGGFLIEIDTILGQMKNNPLLDGITLSGGDPFEQAEVFGILAEKAKSLDYNVVTYTGYTYEKIKEILGKRVGWTKLLNNTDYLVDGKFELAKKSLLLPFRGSANQRIINIQESRKMNKAIQIIF